jgi:uncharacterized protein (DUF1800 family)
MPRFPLFRPRLLVVAVFLAAAAAADPVSVAADRGRAVPADSDVGTVVHVLNRLAFGPRPGDVERVQAIGLEAYIDAQLHPERLNDTALESRLASFETLDLDTGQLSEDYFRPALELRRREAQRATATPAEDAPSMQGGAPARSPQTPQVSPELRMARAAQQQVLNELMNAKMLRAALSERQLQEVLTDFWFNHFNVFVGKGQVRQYLTAYERDVIRPNVLGSFRSLLGAVAQSPAMLFYLDNFQSASPNAQDRVRLDLARRLSSPRLRPDQRRQILQRLERQRAERRPAGGLNENYARELMELHTLGVDGGYTQDDVVELARILTGWTIDRPQQGGSFLFRPAMHDSGTKTLLGVSFAPGGQSEGERALDLLAAHPSTAQHISFKLAQRFVADDPPPALVDRAAAVFLETEGDLREVVRTIVTSPEFFAPEARKAKVKTPLEFVVSAVRATGATIRSAQPLVAAMRNLGMPLYGSQPPTGYSMTADAWVNTGALLNRMNVAVELVSDGRVVPNARPGRGGATPPARANRGSAETAGRVGPGRRLGLGGPISIDVHALVPDATEASRNQLIGLLLAEPVSEATRQTLARADRPEDLVALALGSPEFQRR